MGTVKPWWKSGSRSVFLLALAASSTLLAPASAQNDGAAKELAKWSPQDLAKAEAFVQKFLEELKGENPERAVAAFDTTAMLDQVFDGIGDAKQRAEMKRAAKTSIGPTLLTSLKSVSSGASKWKRFVVVDGTLRARVRFAGDDGIAIVDLELGQSGDAWAFRDLHNLTLGASMVGEMRTMMVLMSPSLSPGLLSRWFGPETYTATDIDNVGKLVKAFQGGNLEGAKALFEKLPKSLQESSPITAVQMQILAAGSDQDAYIAALEGAAARFPAPKFRMTLVDAHFLRKRWKQAIRCLDEAMQGIERDAMLLMLRSTIELQSGDIATARKTTMEALALEPDSLEVLAGSLDILLAAKDWAAVAKTMRAMEKSDQYDFKGQLDDEVWQEFRQQPEAKPWL